MFDVQFLWNNYSLPGIWVYDRCRKNAGQRPVDRQIGQTGAGGAQASGDCEQRNGKGNDLLFTVAIGEGAEDYLEDAELRFASVSAKQSN